MLTASRWLLIMQTSSRIRETEELSEEYLKVSGGDYSLEGFDEWFTHRIWRVCPVKNCKWCKKAGIK